MELDDFKQPFQESMTLSAEQGLNQLHLGKIHGAKSVSLIDKIRRNLLIELVASIIGLLIFSYVAIVTESAWVRQYLLVVIPVVTVFYIDFFLRYRKIQQLVPDASENLLAHLQNTVAIIDRFCRNYIRFNMCFTALAVFSSFYFSAYNNVGPETLGQWLSKPWVWAILLVAGLVGVLLAYGFTKWWLKLLYGKHANQLKQSIEQLQEQHNQHVNHH